MGSPRWVGRVTRQDRTLSLRQFAAAEQRHVSRAVQELGPLWTTADETLEAYGRVADMVERTRASARDDDFAARVLGGNVLLRQAGHACQLDALSLARLHWAQAAAERRRAFEAVVFAWLVWQRPALLAIWSNATLDWDAYRAEFDNAKIKGALLGLSPPPARGKPSVLWSVYDGMSAVIHPSTRGTVHTLTRIATPGRLDRVGPFDGTAYAREGMLPAMRIEWFLDFSNCHLLLLEAFTGRAFVLKEWTPARRDAAALLGTLRGRLRSARQHFAREIRGLRRLRVLRRRAAFKRLRALRRGSTGQTG